VTRLCHDFAAHQAPQQRRFQALRKCRLLDLEELCHWMTGTKKDRAFRLAKAGEARQWALGLAY
jgi:hypothetical protein